MLSYAYNLTNDHTLLDQRDIRTRNHEAILFRVEKPEYYKCYQNPVFRAMSEWNNLNVEIRNAETKSQFIGMVKLQIVNPYIKIL